MATFMNMRYFRACRSRIGPLLAVALLFVVGTKAQSNDMVNTNATAGSQWLGAAAEVTSAGPRLQFLQCGIAN